MCAHMYVYEYVCLSGAPHQMITGIHHPWDKALHNQNSRANHSFFKCVCVCVCISVSLCLCVWWGQWEVGGVLRLRSPPHPSPTLVPEHRTASKEILANCNGSSIYFCLSVCPLLSLLLLKGNKFLTRGFLQNNS